MQRASMFEDFTDAVVTCVVAETLETGRVEHYSDGLECYDPADNISISHKDGVVLDGKQLRPEPSQVYNVLNIASAVHHEYSHSPGGWQASKFMNVLRAFYA